MRVVSNTSPLSNLAIIDRLGLLRARYQNLRIPEEVQDELEKLSHAQAKSRLTRAMEEGWIAVETNPVATTSLPSDYYLLDIGERAAITLALSLKADLLLMDEKRGRGIARQLGISVAGILGELLYAKLQGEIRSLKEEFDRLRKEARFFIDAEIEQFLLKEAGE